MMSGWKNVFPLPGRLVVFVCFRDGEGTLEEAIELSKKLPPPKEGGEYFPFMVPTPEAWKEEVPGLGRITPGAVVVVDEGVIYKSLLTELSEKGIPLYTLSRSGGLCLVTWVSCGKSPVPREYLSYSSPLKEEAAE